VSGGRGVLKFSPRGGQVVWYAEDAQTPEGERVQVKQYAVTTGERTTYGKSHRSYYRVVRLSTPRRGGVTYRGAIFKRSDLLHPVEDAPSLKRKIRRIVRANRKLGDRGCSCQCCTHERVPYRALFPKED
jgi:hypothetical protein